MCLFFFAQSIVFLDEWQIIDYIITTEVVFYFKYYCNALSIASIICYVQCDHQIICAFSRTDQTPAYILISSKNTIVNERLVFYH